MGWESSAATGEAGLVRLTRHGFKDASDVYGADRSDDSVVAKLLCQMGQQDSAGDLGAVIAWCEPTVSHWANLGDAADQPGEKWMSLRGRVIEHTDSNAP